VIQRCGLTEVARKLTGKLSKGCRQRVGLAQALVGDPPLLVLDEPTASLDRTAQAEIVALLRRLRDGGTTLLLCSHRSEEIRAIARRVVELEQGRVVADAPLEVEPSASPLRLLPLDRAVGALP